jgi:hypothetical protein
MLKIKAERKCDVAIKNLNGADLILRYLADAPIDHHAREI